MDLFNDLKKGLVDAWHFKAANLKPIIDTSIVKDLSLAKRMGPIWSTMRRYDDEQGDEVVTPHLGKYIWAGKLKSASAD